MTPEEKERWEDYRTMHGALGGNLALLLDRLTDVMALVGQHRVYCRIEKGPRAGEGTLDVEEALVLLQESKDLVRMTLTELRQGDGSR